MRTCLLGLVFGSALVGSAFADEALKVENINTPAPQPYADRAFQVGAHYRFLTTGLSPYTIDTLGGSLNQTLFSEHRLRVSPIWKLTDRLRLYAEADLLTGLLLGDTTDQIPLATEARDKLNGFTQADTRQVFGEYRFLGTPKQPAGVIRAGLQTSDFGLGLFANSGNRTDTEWGLTHYGDQSFRFLIGGAPVAIATKGKYGRAISLVFAGDLVQEDSLAIYAKGDRAKQGIASLRYTTEKRKAGVYMAYRKQIAGLDAGDIDANGVESRETLDVLAADLFFSDSCTLAGIDWTLAGEFVAVSGETTLNRDNEDPNDIATIAQGGGVLRLEGSKRAFGSELELGFASGDGNPTDNNVTNFSFSRDYNVSLLLFEEVLASQTARDASRASDPDAVGVAPDGVELIPTDSSLNGAQYAKLTVRYRPMENIKLTGAVLAAKASADVVAPFASFTNGGVFANFLGGDSSKRNLGIEADFGANFRYFFLRNPTPIDLSLQAGVLFPGDAFEDAAGNRLDTVYTVQAGFSVPLALDPRGL